MFYAKRGTPWFSHFIHSLCSNDQTSSNESKETLQKSSTPGPQICPNGKFILYLAQTKVQYVVVVVVKLRVYRKQPLSVRGRGKVCVHSRPHL